MPTHDYVCAKCGYEIEVMHSVHGFGPSICPKCGGPMKKAFAVPAVHFKGSGWARKERSGGEKPALAGKDSKDDGARSDDKHGKEASGASAEASESGAGSPGAASGSEPATKDAQ
jgi:putative FmdB family regulatory protein